MASAIGKLIVIEGLEGAGKSTAVETVVDLLAKRHIDVITTREPGGTAIGEQLRAIIKNIDYKDTLDDRSELLLLYTARMQLLKEVIKPALHRGCWVVADRFELSTLAYQGGGRGLDKEMLRHLSSFCLEGFKPDLTLYLDLSPELGMHRAQQRGKFDRIEQQAMNFFHRVHEAYTHYVHSDPNIVTIDASLTVIEVQDAIKKVINQFIER